MLAPLRLLAAAVGGSVAVVLAAVPAAGQVDPDPIDCEADPTAAECQDVQDPPGEDDSPPNGRVCSFDVAQVPCSTSFGFWVGDAADGDWYGLGGDVWPALLVGCWATGASVERDPPSDYPGEMSSGGWYTLSCLGPGGSWPAPGPANFDLAWTPDAGEAAPDPEALARRALASIDLRPPKLVLAPPASGSVPLGMPVWLAVEESSAAWGPISSGPMCEQGLCVEVTATAERVEWRMGDGNSVSCTRGQNTAWQPGMSFLRPGEACHHFYQQPSRDKAGGSYAATATITWLAEWAGGGQFGVFTDVTDACGAGSDEPCTSTVTITVEEIQVLGTQ